jgi:hypothetical protein
MQCECVECQCATELETAVGLRWGVERLQATKKIYQNGDYTSLLTSNCQQFDELTAERDKVLVSKLKQLKELSQLLNHQ